MRWLLRFLEIQGAPVVRYGGRLWRIDQHVPYEDVRGAALVVIRLRPHAKPMRFTDDYPDF